MRIAWIGPIGEGGGVPGMGRVLLHHLLAQGVEVDCFTSETEVRIRELVGGSDNLQVIHSPVHWDWGKWYSRTQMGAFLSNTIQRAHTHKVLCDLLVDRHEARRYDVIFQYSQFELLRLGKYLKELPPVVVYTCVHAAGELTWHRRESKYARESERAIMHYIARAVQVFRASKRRKEAKKPAMLIGMSKRFNELIVQDYDADPSRLRVLYHPIEPPTAETTIIPIKGQKIRIVFAGRISVRKGVEMMVQLSNRLDDLADQIQIDVIGGHTQWSDYRKHLSELNPRTAKYLGGQGNEKLLETFARSDILVTPSHYEPGGIVVGEAASRGMCIVASDEVGSAEPLDGPFVIKFPTGDMVAFERSVREMITRVKADRVMLGKAARQASLEEFAPEKIAAKLLGYFREAAGTKSSDRSAVGSRT